MKDLLRITVHLCAGVATAIVFQAILTNTPLGRWIDRAADWMSARFPSARQWHVLAVVLAVGFVALVLRGHLS